MRLLHNSPSKQTQQKENKRREEEKESAKPREEGRETKRREKHSAQVFSLGSSY